MTNATGRSAYFMDQYSDNRIVRDLLKGLSALRNTKSFTSTESGQGGSNYLPKFPNESNEMYKMRLSRSYLTNFFKRAIQTDSGKILSAPLNININDNTEIPEAQAEWFDNLDLDGSPIDVIASDQLRGALAKGVALAFVDYIEESNTPFVVQIDIDDVLDFKADRRTGRLSYLKWNASRIVDSEEASSDTDNQNVIFEVTPTTWKMFEEGNDSEPLEEGVLRRFKDGREEITNEIPVSIFYVNKTGPLLAESPYIDLAEMTIEHFQLSSDIKNNLMFALTPMLFGKGLPADATIDTLAAWQFLSVDDSYEKADISWIQADAAPIKQARELISDVEDRIALFGVDISGIRATGAKTATQVAINSAGTNAALETFAKGLSEHMERLIVMMASYTVEAIDVDVTITPDFSVNNNNDNVKNALEAYKLGGISRRALTDVMVNNNILPKEFSIEEDIAFEAEIDALMDTYGITDAENVTPEKTDGTVEKEKEATDESDKEKDKKKEKGGEDKQKDDEKE